MKEASRLCSIAEMSSVKKEFLTTLENTAKTGLFYMVVRQLPVQNENTKAFIEWLKSEGFIVRENSFMEKKTFVFDADPEPLEVRVTEYTISWHRSDIGFCS